jgi:hypothetical protein
MPAVPTPAPSVPPTETHKSDRSVAVGTSSAQRPPSRTVRSGLGSQLAFATARTSPVVGGSVTCETDTPLGAR